MKKDQAERPVEHFKQVLNHPHPGETANIESAVTPIESDIDLQCIIM